MRRLSTTLLVLCFLLSSCTGSGVLRQKNEPESAAQNQNLELALFQGGFGEEYWKEVITDFSEQYPNSVINYKIHPNIGDLIRPALLSGEYPDFLYHSDSSSDGLVTGLIKSRVLTDLTDVFNSNAYRSEEPLRNQFLPGLLENPRYSPYNDNHIYLAPFSYGPLGLAYNKTLFEKNGWSVPKTWEEFINLGELAKEKNIALITYPGLYPGYLESLIFPAIANSAGMETLERIFNLDGEAFDAPGALSALRMVRLICGKDYLLDGSFEMNHLQSQAAVLMDEALFIPNGIWIQNEMHGYDRTEGFQFALAAGPVLSKDSTHYVQISYEQMSIPKDAKNPEFAKEFLRYLYCDESVKVFAERADGVFSLTRALELGKPYMDPTVYNMYAILEDDKVSAYVPAFVNSSSSGAVPVRDLILTSFAKQVIQDGQPVELWAEDIKLQMSKMKV